MCKTPSKSRGSTKQYNTSRLSRQVCLVKQQRETEESKSHELEVGICDEQHNEQCIIKVEFSKGMAIPHFSFM